jgi:hypothetical protein
MKVRHIEGLMAQRVPYGEDDAPISKREYILLPSSPVGTIKDMVTLCRKHMPEMKVILLFDRDDKKIVLIETGQVVSQSKMTLN